MRERIVNMAKKIGKWKYLLAALFVVLACVVVELASNWKLLFLPEEERGLQQVNLEGKSGMGDEEARYALDVRKGGALTVDLGGRYVKYFSYEYSFDTLLDMDVSVTYLNPYGEREVLKLKDSSPRVIGSSAIELGERVEKIQMSLNFDRLDSAYTEEELNGMSLEIFHLSVDNRPAVNLVRLLLTAAIAGGLMLLILFWGHVGTHPEYGFLWIALSVGMILIFAFPPTKVGWDEETHFRRAYQLSIWPGSAEDTVLYPKMMDASSLENWPLNVPQSKPELDKVRDTLNEYADNGVTAVVDGDTSGIYTPGYLPHAVGIKLARALGMSYTWVYMAGRIGGLVFYCIMMFLAIRFTPVGKRIMLLISLMPEVLFLAVTYTYDSVVLACVMLGLALLFREMYKPEGKISWWVCLLSILILCGGILPKAVYAPLLLLGLFLPLSGFKKKWQGWCWRGGYALGFLLLMASFVIPTLLSPGTGDVRGGAVDPGLQMSQYVLGQPLQYAQVLLKNIFETLPEDFAGKWVFCQFGHLGVYQRFYLVYLIAFAVIATDRHEEEHIRLKAGRRIGIFAVVAVSVALVWTSMYIAYNVPGATAIQGVQGRYYLPLMFPLYLILNTRLIQVRTSRINYSNAVLLMSAVLAYGASYWQMCERYL